MSHEIEKKILQLRLRIAGHLSNINIKVEHLEGQYIHLLKEIGELEDRVRELEKKIDRVVYLATRNVLLFLSGLTGAIYSIVKIIEHFSGK